MNTTVRLGFVVDELKQQIAQLLPNLPERFFGDLPGNIDRLGLDVLIGDGVTTIGADGALEVAYPLRLGTSPESLVSALRKVSTEPGPKGAGFLRP